MEVKMNFALLPLAVVLLSAPDIEVSEQSFDFGYAYVGESYRHTFWIYNRGDDNLKIESVRTFCNCAVTEVKNRNLLPGDSTSFDFVFNTGGFFAERVKWAYIRTTDPTDSLVKVNVTVRLFNDYDRTPFKIIPAMLHFGSIDDLRDQQVLSITNTSQTTYRIRLVERSPALADFEFAERDFAPGEEITLTLRPKSSARSAVLFQSCLVFEAFTPTEVVRFSVPLHLKPER